LNSYNDDIITLSFSEDVSLSVGTLAHLYKLLYWSKPRGKGIVPENLLRFNCDIIVSEVRNFNRVRKATGSGELEIIKDNVSRYVYSLKECQFYFNNMPHDSTINLGNIAPHPEGSYVVQFDYKYSTSKLERFMPSGDGFGKYVGYNNGAIWKIGNPGERSNRTGTQSIGGDTSVPRFFTTGDNTLNKSGVLEPFILSTPIDNQFKRTFFDNDDGSSDQLSGLEKFKKNAKSGAREIKNRLEDVAIRAATRELQTFINTRAAILNKTLNKILNSSGVTQMRPPRNIYTDKGLTPGQRIFYDIRGELGDFLGGALGGALGGGGITSGVFNPR